MGQERKTVSITTTIHLLWDAAELSSYRESLKDDRDFMARHNEQIASGEPIWVACHDRRITLQVDGLLRIGKQTYQVREEVEDKRYLRCVCAGCSFDLDYCQVNHSIRVYEWVYADLAKKAKRPPTNLVDGTIIRFEKSIEFVDGTQHDVFRKDSYRQRVRRNGERAVQRRTVF